MNFIKERKDDIIKVILLSIIFIWTICFLIDYIRVRRNNEPIFCIKENIKEYDDGTVYECVGMGYKTYKYDRTSIPITVQFGPFFLKERTK